MKLEYLKQLPYTQRSNLIELAEIVLKKASYCEREEHNENVVVFKSGRFYVSLCELCKKEVESHIADKDKRLELIQVG